MKLLTLAIASVVDANTRQGFTQQYLQHSPTKVSEQIDRGRVIRARSVVGIFSKLVRYFDKLIEQSKARAQLRKDIKQLSELNDHMLEDIGLNRSDIRSVKSGLITIDELNARREAGRVPSSHLAKVRKTNIGAGIANLQSANQDDFGLAKCC